MQTFKVVAKDGRKNIVKIVLSRTISKINAFYKEIQDATKKGKEKDFWSDTLGVKNFTENDFYLAPFLR